MAACTLVGPDLVRGLASVNVFSVLVVVGGRNCVCSVVLFFRRSVLAVRQRVASTEVAVL